MTADQADAAWFITPLTVLFLALKLTGAVTWSWIVVLSPLWVPLAMVLSFVVTLAFMILMGWMSHVVHRR